MSDRLNTVHERLRSVSESDLVATRATLHMIAERVLATDLFGATRRIGLRPTFGGFGQPEHQVDGQRRRVRLDGEELVVLHEVHEHRHQLTTLGEALNVLDGTAPIEHREPFPYTPTSADDPNASLELDRVATELIAVVFDLGAELLERVRQQYWPRQPAIVELWPEHFDLATRVGDVMVGVSPGDAAGLAGGRLTPYLYVAPSVVTSNDDYWNEPYGAAIGLEEIRSVEHAAAFFSAGLGPSE